MTKFLWVLTNVIQGLFVLCVVVRETRQLQKRILAWHRRPKKPVNPDRDGWLWYV